MGRRAVRSAVVVASVPRQNKDQRPAAASFLRLVRGVVVVVVFVVQQAPLLIPAARAHDQQHDRLAPAVSCYACWWSANAHRRRY